MGDDVDSASWRPQGSDYFYLLGAGIGTTATDLLIDGQGTTSPVVPDFFVLRFKQVRITNRGGATALVTIQGYSVIAGLPTPIPFFTYNVAGSSSVTFDEGQFADIIPPSYGVQAYVSAGSADIQALCYPQKG